MSSLKLHTLKQKLWAIVLASFVARVVMFFVLPSTPSLFAPDEGTYANLAKWVSQSKPVSDFPGFGNELYLSSRSIIIPSSLIVRAGFNELEAIRITSGIYGLLALLLVASIILRFSSNHHHSLETSRSNQRLIVGLFFVYAFLPSHFLWSNLGLRESGNEFWLILVFVLTYRILRSPRKASFGIQISLMASIVLVFSSRPQVGWVVVITLVFAAAHARKSHNRYTFVFILLIGMFLGHLSTSPLKVEFQSDFYLIETAKGSNALGALPKTEDDTFQSQRCASDGDEVEIGKRSFICQKTGEKLVISGVKSPTAKLVDQVEIIPIKQTANQVGAASQIETIGCPFDDSMAGQQFACMAWRAPYMTSTFLFRPLPFIDTTTQTNTFAAIENTLWILMFILIFYRISKVKKIPFFKELAPVFMFFSLYVVGAGSYEGNMGTAFRHKSLILWVPLLLIFVLFWHRDSQTKDSIGNNSQESAV